MDERLKGLSDPGRTSSMAHWSVLLHLGVAAIDAEDDESGLFHSSLHAPSGWHSRCTHDEHSRPKRLPLWVQK
jgi:hypothetical protein